ncbi:fibronectin type III domain-containing protein [Candidatus Peregrinibacteria bacterium]|nr:fibronectin type III domain-containing protein [Candidatus Peregrinibacteria bacterium]
MNTKKIFICLTSALLFAAQSALAAGTPGNVTGVEATPVDSGSIGLTWGSVKDAGGGLVDHYRIYYGTFSVFEAGEGDYENEVDTKDNTASYVVDGLKADTTYYFSVTAFSSDDLESEEYSLEASAKTMNGEGGEGEGESETDTTPPTVNNVSAPDKMHVKVVFSEAVQLPIDPEAAFGIVEQINPANTLTVVSVGMDETDPSNKTVLLETSEQTPNINYIVTAGVTVKDLADNPIVSGSTDSGLFLGSSVEPAAEGSGEEAAEEEPATDEGAAAEEEPVVAEAKDCAEDMSCFLPYLADCSAAKVSEKGEIHEYTLEITGPDATNCLVKYTADRHPSILYAGTDMVCKVAAGDYENAEAYRAAFDILKCTGDLAAGYKAVELKDTTPPENVTNLLLTFREELEKYTVFLSWTASLNTAKDLVDQMLYKSLDRGSTYDAGKSLGASATNTEVANLDGGKEYTFKVTTKDASGNESTGAVKSIRLPQTGLGVGLLLLGSVAAAGRLLRRKEDNEL